MSACCDWLAIETQFVGPQSSRLQRAWKRSGKEIAERSIVVGVISGQALGGACLAAQVFVLPYPKLIVLEHAEVSALKAGRITCEIRRDSFFTLQRVICVYMDTYIYIYISIHVYIYIYMFVPQTAKQ